MQAGETGAAEAGKGGMAERANSRARRKGRAAGMVVLALLAACGPQKSGPITGDLTGEIQRTNRPGPPDGPPGACWEADILPAIIETVTEQVQVSPEKRDASGKLVAPASYRSETRQHIARERQMVYFRTPCPAEMTVEFIASVQRALLARGYYTGPLTGQIDAATAAALRRYQAERGLDSARLSLGAARLLGLSTVPLEDL